MTGSQWFCLSIVAMVMLAGVGIAWAEAWGRRRSGCPDDELNPDDREL